MPARAPLLVGILAALTLACGSEPDSVSESAVSELPDVAVQLEVGGTYRVSGLTVELESGRQRKIAGTLVLSRRGDEYRSSFELATTLPSPDGALFTDVIGTGQGRIDADGVLRGTARTQLVIGAVAGIPTQFPFVPRFVGPRVVSETVTTFGDDGSVEIEIETRGEEGESYVATRTTLAGTLVPGTETTGSPVLR
jgi:hypothetical protein